MMIDKDWKNGKITLRFGTSEKDVFDCCFSLCKQIMEVSNKRHRFKDYFKED